MTDITDSAVVPTIHGQCEDRFAGVQEAFEANFANGEELGASVFVTVAGEPVVDLWAGDATPAGDPWQQDTIVNVYSTTKTMAGTCVLMLADRGQLDLHAPVATYWPEFAANGKQDITVAHVMAHTAGLSGFEAVKSAEDLYDWDAVVAELAAMAPWWDDRSQPGYHAVTQGYLQGEIVRRVDGRDIDTFFREEVSGPLGADFHMSVPAEADARCGELIPPPGMALEAPDGQEIHPIAMRTGLSHPLVGTEPKTRAWREAVIPAAGGFGNARSVGRVHSALACGGEVDGVRLMSSDTVRGILEEQSAGRDWVLGQEIRFGMGFGLSSPLMPMPPTTFFWGGWGGSLAVIDLDAQMTVSYVMNRMAVDLINDQRGGQIALAAFTAALS